MGSVRVGAARLDPDLARSARGSAQAYQHAARVPRPRAGRRAGPALGASDRTEAHRARKGEGGNPLDEGGCATAACCAPRAGCILGEVLSGLGAKEAAGDGSASGGCSLALHRRRAAAKCIVHAL